MAENRFLEKSPIVFYIVLLPLGAKFRQNSKKKNDSWAICPPEIVA